MNYQRLDASLNAFASGAEAQEWINTNAQGRVTVFIGQNRSKTFEMFPQAKPTKEWFETETALNEKPIYAVIEGGANAQA